MNEPHQVDTQPSNPAPQINQPQQQVEQALDRLHHVEELIAAETGRPPVDFEPPCDFELPVDFKLSVVIPVYNEEKTIREIISRVRGLPLRKELIIVDDHSTDGTAHILSEIAQFDDVRVLYKPQNEGKGAALRTGFQSALGDVVIVQDADLEYDPHDIPGLLPPILNNEADVVYGSRFLHEVPQDPSRFHRMGNGLLTKTSNLFTGFHLTDMETCYKAFRRDVLDDIEIAQNRFGFEPEITAKLARRGWRILETPISYHARGYEEGKKIGVKDALNAFYCIVRYGWTE